MKRAILFGVPHHSNLGDHAIAIAEKKIIETEFSEYLYREIAEENIHKCLDKIKPYINNQDIIFLHGGGNLGNEYLFTESGRRKIIETFPNNKIILFPQTMFFEDNEHGRKELEISKKVYNSHDRIFFMAREEISYKIMKKEFKTDNIFLTQDIVTILQESNQKTHREGLLFIIRKDTESKVETEFIEQIKKIGEKIYSKIEFTDTAKGGYIYENQRKNALNEMLDKYRSSELVITDRLHGMIFAVITGTPCIAIGNYNHKIEASAKWFKDLPYIHYISNNEKLEDVEKYMKNSKNTQKYLYSNEKSLKIFEDVFKKIKESN